MSIGILKKFQKIFYFFYFSFFSSFLDSLFSILLTSSADFRTWLKVLSNFLCSYPNCTILLWKELFRFIGRLLRGAKRPLDFLTLYYATQASYSSHRNTTSIKYCIPIHQLSSKTLRLQTDIHNLFSLHISTPG